MYSLRTFMPCLLVIILAATASAGDITGTVTCKGVRDSRDVVVYLVNVPGEFPPPEENVKMDQVNLEFIPHVLPIVAGTTVDFLNNDEVMHNVFTPDKEADKFNLGSWPKGEIRSYTFDVDCGDICSPVMLCNVHPEMEAYVVVLKNPYFAVTDKAGNFTIEGVPAGDLQLKLWHEKLKGEGTMVTIPVEGEVEVSLEMHR
jgi:plastocyanin